jgi:hypothetical protein
MSPRGLAAFRLAAFALALYGVAPLAYEVLRAPDRVPGGEAYWIAQSVAAGKGFSMPDGHRWLFDPVDNNMFLRLTDEPVHPTAWSDPLYTLSLAAILRVAGPRYQFWAALMNVVLMVLALLLAYLIAESLGAPAAGILALLFLVNVNGFTQRPYFGMVNTQLAAALVAGSALAVVWYFKDPSVRRAGVVGFLLGVTALGCPAAQLFIPGTAAGVILHEWKAGRNALLRAAIVVLVAALVILPWTVRNYRALHQTVPVRTGFGQIAFIGTVALGGVLDSTTLGSMPAPPMEAASARRAVKALLRPPFREIAALEEWQLEYAKERGGPEYPRLNEAERDDWFLAESKSFLLSHPGLGARLALAKLEAFVRIMGPLGILVCLLAALGGLVRARTPAVTVLVIWVVAFVIPYLVAVTYYARYRSPIEPILAVLAGLGVWSAVGAMIPAARGLDRQAA